VPCWISSRDVAPGANYQEAIVTAIRTGRAVVVLISEAANASDEVKKELSLASAAGVSVYPVRLGAVTPNPALSYELATRQWIEGGEVPAIAATLVAAIQSAEPASERPSPEASPTQPALALPEKPSLVVLPFQNMSGDQEQEYFVDGLVEDITTALSRIRSLFVIARNSAFTYKGRAVDVRQIGRELGVRYVLEGSVRKSGDRLRITGQLIDATSGTHIWADRFDGTVGEVFELQDQVAATVAGAIEPQLRRAEIQRAVHKPTESLQAYDMLLRAMPYLYPHSYKGTLEAVRLLRRATEIDAEFALASVLLAFFYNLPVEQGWDNSMPPPPGEINRLIRVAAKSGANDPEVLTWCGFLTAHAGADVEAGNELVRRALIINPNSAFALQISGQLRAYIGDTATALDHLQRCLRLDPTSVAVGRNYAFAVAYFVAAQYDAVVEVTTKGLSENSNSAAELRLRAASLGLLGRIDEARATVRRITDRYGTWTISRVRHRIEVIQNNIFRKPGVTDSIYEGLRLAGMPE